MNTLRLMLSLMTAGLVLGGPASSGQSSADPTAVAGLVEREAEVGLLYVVIGMALLGFFEAESRRRATLHTA